jgi:hypothetical protein
VYRIVFGGLMMLNAIQFCSHPLIVGVSMNEYLITVSFICRHSLLHLLEAENPLYSTMFVSSSVGSSNNRLRTVSCLEFDDSGRTVEFSPVRDFLNSLRDMKT